MRRKLKMGKEKKEPYFKGFILWEEEIKQKKVGFRTLL